MTAGFLNASIAAQAIDFRHGRNNPPAAEKCGFLAAAGGAGWVTLSMPLKEFRDDLRKTEALNDLNMPIPQIRRAFSCKPKSTDSALPLRFLSTVSSADVKVIKVKLDESQEDTKHFCSLTMPASGISHNMLKEAEAEAACVKRFGAPCAFGKVAPALFQPDDQIMPFALQDFNGNMRVDIANTDDPEKLPKDNGISAGKCLAFYSALSSQKWATCCIDRSKPKLS